MNKITITTLLLLLITIGACKKTETQVTEEYTHTCSAYNEDFFFERWFPYYPKGYYVFTASHGKKFILRVQDLEKSDEYTLTSTSKSKESVKCDAAWAKMRYRKDDPVDGRELLLDINHTKDYDNEGRDRVSIRLYRFFADLSTDSDVAFGRVDSDSLSVSHYDTITLNSWLYHNVYKIRMSYKGDDNDDFIDSSQIIIPPGLEGFNSVRISDVYLAQNKGIVGFRNRDDGFMYWLVRYD